MALIIAILLGICFWLYCANDKANILKRRNDYAKDHPPCKYQEEYLLACGYYHQYLFDGEPINDAYGHALKSARIDIYNSGYLPSHLVSAGLSFYDEDAPAMQMKSSFSAHYWIEPHDPPNGVSTWKDRKYGTIKYTGFVDIRDKETNFAYLQTDLRTSKYKDDKKWIAYCKGLDDKFDSLVIQSLVDYGIVDGKIHKGEAYITERETIWHGKNPEFREYKTREFKTKWIDYNRLAKAPWPVRDIVHYNGSEYEKILELHKDELPVYLANKRERKPLQPKKEPETPYGR